jgi:predicted esterase
LGGPSDAFLPRVTGVCPEFTEGRLTFSPRGIAPRDVQIWISTAAQTLDGPLLFLWHGTGGSPATALNLLGTQALNDVRARGGIVAAPYNDPATGQFPWFVNSSSGRDDDLLVADEVVACAIQKAGIDRLRIHSMGFSAGALHTTEMSWRRSGYVASVVTLSGGGLETPADQDASNKFAAMIAHGGPSDVAAGFPFQAASERYRDRLRSEGHFTVMCNHNSGHAPVLPASAAWLFLQAHPFGTRPSPWSAQLPAGLPSYCAL